MERLSNEGCGEGVKGNTNKLGKGLKDTMEYGKIVGALQIEEGANLLLLGSVASEAT